MGERIDPSALVGTWTQVDPEGPTVLILAADGHCEFEIPTADLAGLSMSFRAIGGEWSLTGDLLRITLRFTSDNSWAESEMEYVVVECGQRLALRGLEDKAEEVAYFQRVGRT